MPRNMSFAMTTDQIKAQTKTVTRRFGWWFLKPGDVVRGVEKAMGLKKGEKVKQLAMVRIVSTRPEPLNAITQEDVIREGFPDWTPSQFIQMLVDHYKIDPAKTVNRIEFEYL
ncbi:MAG: ASCH domain-containing protein [Candidatus Sedimenticola sp. (ex Thyasira tokunagai)]